MNFAGYWQGGQGFGLLWQLFRDLINFFIAVLFIFAAVRTILGDWAQGKKLLLILLGAALFVNFSAFLVLLLFDASHIILITLFNALNFNVLLEQINTVVPDSSEETGAGFTYFILGTVNGVVGFFTGIGFFWFSIILIERFIVAFLLVITSPLAAIGVFAKYLDLKGASFINSFIQNPYKVWLENLNRALISPILLMFGLFLATQAYTYVITSVDDSDPSKIEFLATTIFIAVVYIICIFKIGEFVRSSGNAKTLAGVHSQAKSMLNMIPNDIKTGYRALRGVVSAPDKADKNNGKVCAMDWKDPSTHR